MIRLDKGELFVHAPVAPTKEYVTMLKELGNVKYIVLPVTAVEHKVYMAKFVKQFPQAKVYVAPGQFSWPIDLPLGFKVDGILTEENKKDVPFAKEIDYTGWFYRPFTGSISEVAFFHKKSKTLLVTDAVIYIDEEPPEVLKRQGVKPSLWKKMALQACFLGPPNLDTFDELKKKLLVSPVIRCEPLFVILFFPLISLSLTCFYRTVQDPCHLKGQEGGSSMDQAGVSVEVRTNHSRPLFGANQGYSQRFKGSLRFLRG